MMTYNTIPHKPRYSFISEEANKLTLVYSFPPIPVLEIAESNGVEVIFSRFDKYKNEVSGFCDFNDKKLYINTHDKAERQIFTIAHEFGHWILHKEFFLREPEKYEFLPRFHSADKENVLEQEANHFAASLLVPPHLLNPVKNAPIEKLCHVFNVSRTMMENRLRNCWKHD